jgi:hypothetical protein
VNTTIADLLDAATVAQLKGVAAQAKAPDLVDAQCTFCKADLKIELPIVGTIACVGCGQALASGKSGRRFTKRPQVDLSNYTDAELGRMVRQVLLDNPLLTPEQEIKVEGLMEVLHWDYDKAAAFIITRENA